MFKDVAYVTNLAATYCVYFGQPFVNTFRQRCDIHQTIFKATLSFFRTRRTFSLIFRQAFGGALMKLMPEVMCDRRTSSKIFCKIKPKLSSRRIYQLNSINQIVGLIQSYFHSDVY